MRNCFLTLTSVQYKMTAGKGTKSPRFNCVLGNGIAHYPALAIWCSSQAESVYPGIYVPRHSVWHVKNCAFTVVIVELHAACVCVTMVEIVKRHTWREADEGGLHELLDGQSVVF